ncbi:MAG: hypothetical protein WD646_07885 [Actinomycetota bacterium]
MGRAQRRRLVVALALIGALLASASLWLAPGALAQNDQEGNNSSNVDQDGDTSAGDAIGGQSVSVTGGARVNVDATNSSRGVRARTGEAEATNTASSSTGQSATGEDGDSASNNQDGDNEFDLSQSADATTGDAVAGQVIGVTSRGDTTITATNTSEDVDLVSGDATASNDAEAFVGLLATSEDDGLQLNVCDDEFCINLDAIEAANDQDGDNSADVDQSADASSGDALGGQVIGVASGGNTTINASNTSQDVDATTGDAESSNAADVLVGLVVSAANEGAQINVCENQIGGFQGGDFALCINAAIANAANEQDGDNSADLDQNADADTGDGFGGQAISVASSGDSSIRAANRSEDVDVTTGDAEASNDADVAVGQFLESGNEGLQLNLCGNQIGGTRIANVAACINFALANGANDQDGDNSADVDQNADAASGDGVGGQLIGATSGGNTTIDATNDSEGVDVRTGDAESSNNADVLVGLVAAGENEGVQLNICGNQIGGTSIANLSVCINAAVSNVNNDQDGDNTADVGQSADASTGDGIGGQVIGAASGGDSTITASNRSEDVDVVTGDADADNDADVLVGLVAEAANEGAQINICGNQIGGEEIATFSVCVNAAVSNVSNDQDGDNTADVGQSADASTGDGVGGQVIGALSAGDSNIDATNRSDNVDIRTGDADASNSAEVIAGLFADNENDLFQLNLCASGICTNLDIEFGATNVQNGDNEADTDQRTDASTGDGVAGQVLGVFGEEGGSSDIVASNESTNINVTSGNESTSNTATTTIGLVVGPSPIDV